MAKSSGKFKEKSLHEKFKQFFGFKEVTPLNFDHLKTEPYKLSEEMVKELLPGNSVNHRLKALKDLCDIVTTKHLPENTVEMLFTKTEDMLKPHHTAETRHIVLQFYCILIQGQLRKMAIMRSAFFRLIQKHEIAEDSLLRLEVLKALSESGKNITYFEEEIGPFLLNWFSHMLGTGRATEFLPLVINIIKFNAAYLDENIIKEFIRHACAHCGKSTVVEEIELCLHVMDAVLCYSHLPSKVLQNFILALCIAVNTEKLAHFSWKLMRNLLGTSVGHTTIFTLCLFLQDRKTQKVPEILRGAIFYIGMALWGSKKVESLKHPLAAVLPSFLTALDNNSNIIAYEVSLSMQRLVKKSSLMQNNTWDIILSIIERLLKYPDLQQPGPPSGYLATSVHDLISAVEESEASYCSDRLYKIIEGCSDRRNEDSVIRLIQHRMQYIHPIKDDFIQNITDLLEKYFKNEKRLEIQLKVVQVLHNVRVTNGRFFDDELFDGSLLHYMFQIDKFPDAVLRKAVIDFLLEIAETCITKRYFDILDIIEKAMKGRFNNLSGIVTETSTQGKLAYLDIESAVCGLIHVFERKLHTLPSSHCVRIFNMLVNHIQTQYTHLSFTEAEMKIRRLIMGFFMKIRANSKMQVGLCLNGKVEYSVYVSCISSRDTATESALSIPASPSADTPNVFNLFPMSLNFEDMFQILITALKQEKDWSLLELLFKEVPKLLQNKALIICSSCNLNSLCSTLCLLVNDKAYGEPDNLYNVPARFTRTEFRAHIFPVIACLTAYHSHLESHKQHVLIRCLQSGLVSRSAKVCIEGLTLCTLEMRNMMVKLMPAVLLKLSQISATVSVSVVVLEFLSNLIRLPQLYVSFVEDQYRSIFAIALPYTNPRKFNRYTVALAHHVIAMWFLKCRIPFRKEFAKYITKGLRGNISLSCQNSSSNQSSAIDTATDKSSSGNSSSETSVKEPLVNLHAELLEIGLDLMSRFTFGMCSNAPKRSDVAEFLLENGQKASWMIGNRIITITTSGCGTKALKQGLCAKCYASCREICESMESDDSESALSPTPEPLEPVEELPPIAPNKERRRHRSAFHQRRATLSYELQNARNTKDDILLHRQKLNAEERVSRRNTTCSARDIPEAVQSDQTGSENNDDKKSSSYQLCSCWCSGWAEVYVRRPTGNTSWMLKIQNHLSLPTSPTPSLPLAAISSLILPHKVDNAKVTQKDNTPENLPLSTNKQEELDLDAFEFPAEDTEEGSASAISEALMCPRPKVNLRRSNSSPDMNSGWSNFENHMNAHRRPLLHSATIEEPSQADAVANDPFEMFQLEEKDEVREIKGRPSSKIMHEWSNSEQSSMRNSVDFELSFGNSTSGVASGHGSRRPSDLGGDSSAASSAFRDRVHTISVMSPVRSSTVNSRAAQKGKDMHRSGMNPSFVFLQLYHNSFFGPSSLRPLHVRHTEQNNRSLRVLDHIHPYDTHKIGVVYVGPGQENDEPAILGNMYGSLRYVEFLRGLGNLVRLSDVDQTMTYLGGLDIRGGDGKFALVWHDDVMRVAFHVATLLPNKKSDPQRNNKKTHIGNDFIVIVYNESGEDYNICTIKSQFTTSCVIIRPEDYNSNVVTIKVKTEELLETFGHTDSYIVSDESLPIFVRQLALHANLASLILDPRQQSAHVSTWLARLRSIKRLRSNVLKESKLRGEHFNTDNQSDVFIDDFTDYV